MSRSRSRARAFTALRNRLPVGHSMPRMFVVSSLMALAVPLSAATTTILVNTTVDSLDSDSTVTSLREAFRDIDNGAYTGQDVVITLPAGTYRLNKYMEHGDLDLTTGGLNSLTIRGASATATIIDGMGRDRIFDFQVAETINIERLAIQNGKNKGLDGLDGVWGQSVGSGNDNGASGSSVTGGGIYFSGSSTITMTQVVVRNCVAQGGDGGDGADMVPNESGSGSAGDGGWGASAQGGGVYFNAGSNITLTDCAFLNNTAQSGKGGDGGNATAGDMSYVSGGDASYGSSAQGGGVYFSQPTQLTVENCVFTGNKAVGGDGGNGGDAAHATTSSAYGGYGYSGGDATGGGIYLRGNSSADYLFKDVVISNNQAIGGKGGNGGDAWDAYSNASASTGSTGGSASGAGMYARNCALLSIVGDSRITGNLAQAGDGGVAGNAYDAGDTATASSGGDGGSASGGGLYFTNGNLHFGALVISGNRALAGNGGKGGFAKNGAANDYAGDGGDAGEAQGGAVYFSGTSLTLTNGGPTYAGNVATQGVRGLGGKAINTLSGFTGTLTDGTDGTVSSIVVDESIGSALPTVFSLVSGHAWRDVGSSANTEDSTDTNIADVLVTIRDATPRSLAKMYTDSAGLYAFDTSYVGSGTATFAKPGETPVTQTVSTVDGSDINGAGVASITITAADTDLPDIDAGYQPRAAATMSLVIVGTVTTGTTSVRIGSTEAVIVGTGYTLSVTVPPATTEVEMITTKGGATSSRIIHINPATTAGG
ncbi:MAG: hypothetical protein H0W72_07030 [Planctomycetes bacterium]|nr:hypothetical protein [Planctomycetota bacterium]